MQVMIDAAHKSKTNDHEMTLKSRDEYLKNLENRLIQQERGNEEERLRLQNLVSKMEIQLREQTRQIEQDKWKLTQEENRVKAIQVCRLLRTTVNILSKTLLSLPPPPKKIDDLIFLPCFLRQIFSKIGRVTP